MILQSLIHSSFHVNFNGTNRGRITGRPEVIGSSVELVPTNGLMTSTLLTTVTPSLCQGSTDCRTPKSLQFIGSYVTSACRVCAGFPGRRGPECCGGVAFYARA